VVEAKIGRGENKLSLVVMFLVLVGAVLHAIWNAIIKAGSDKQLDTLLVICGAAIFVPFALPFAPPPGKASWPYLGATVAIHFAHFNLIALAYRTGDLSYAYPIMRGSAPPFDRRPGRRDCAGNFVIRCLAGHRPNFRWNPCAYG
jgi:drug/metabolite transporter (DMT)-like permease